MSLVAVNPTHFIGLLISGFREIARATGEEADINHVVDQLDGHNKSAHLFIDSDATGFVILRVVSEFIDGSQSLYVLAAYKQGGDGMSVYDKEIEEIAREIGVSKVVFRTKRKSLIRLSKRHQYTNSGYFAEKEL